MKESGSCLTFCTNLHLAHLWLLSDACTIKASRMIVLIRKIKEQFIVHFRTLLSFVLSESSSISLFPISNVTYETNVSPTDTSSNTFPAHGAQKKGPQIREGFALLPRPILLHFVSLGF